MASRFEVTHQGVPAQSRMLRRRASSRAVSLGVQHEGEGGSIVVKKATKKAAISGAKRAAATKAAAAKAIEAKAIAAKPATANNPLVDDPEVQPDV